MNNSQRTLLSMYMPITMLILTFDWIYPKAEMIEYIRYIAIIALAMATGAVKKKSLEQKIMAFSFLFVVIADYFLVFSTTIDGINRNLAPFGIVAFTLAYICLIISYHKNFKIGKPEIITSIPIIIISSAVYITLLEFMSRGIAIIAFIFGIVLSFMTWTAINTISRKYYRKKIAGVIALSGIMMYICDIGVAFRLFHPYFSAVYVPIYVNIVWGAYALGWTLLAVVINEEKLTF
jgi:hypothetical protein